MGKRLPKRELLAEIDKERRKLLDLLDSIPRKQFNLPGLNSAGWSIKDVLTHLLDWEVRVVGWCQMGKTEEIPELPGDGFKWNQLKELNGLIQKRHAKKSIKRVLEELELAHQETIETIGGFSDQELTTLNQFAWTGNSWTVSDYLRSNTASHYKWATAKIRKYLRSQTQT